MKMPNFDKSLELIVRTIDWTDVNRIVSEKLKLNLYTNPNGLIEFKDENGKDKYILIDKDCCGCGSESPNFMFDDSSKNGFVDIVSMDSLKVDFWERSVTDEKTGYTSHSMFPVVTLDMDIDIIKRCASGKMQSLIDFMGSRYGYNPRILTNERKILKEVFGKIKKIA